MSANEKPRFIVIDRGAAGELVAERAFQSVDFPGGLILVHLLTGLSSTPLISKSFRSIHFDNGLFFLSSKGENHDVLIIDLQEAPIFDSRSSSEALLIFQKVTRFAIKRWERMAFTLTERTLPNSTKALLFPFLFSAQVPFRITFELAPDQRRREKRAKGEEILLYKCGTEEGGGAHEEANTTNFKKVIASLPGARATALLVASATSSTNGGQGAVAVTRLMPGNEFLGIGEATYAEWLPLLTNSQREFIQSELVTPHRIEGPAGTGKTLSLVLKCIFALLRAHDESRPHRALFVAHSEATRRNIARLFEPEISNGSISGDDIMAMQSVKVCTLHSYCAEVLNTEISEAEFLDRDAFESKQTQLLYALEAVSETISNDFTSHKRFMSEKYSSFIEHEDRWVLAEMLQHEISVIIKGRADEDEGKYKKIHRLTYGLPIENDGDKIFTFLVFKNYRKRLEQSGQFDTDDIVLSALGQLNTPIWRRRRLREGFDSIFIDETHLFNLNELSVFHRLTKSEENYPIAYSADVSQSLGDRGWDDETLDDAMGVPNELAAKERSTVFKSIFRCSPEIVNLAFSVTSSGATLFTNFHDPIAAASSAFTYEEEKKCAHPLYWLANSDEQMYKRAFSRADEMATEIGCHKADIAIVAFGDAVFAELEKVVKGANKPVEIIKQRGDFDVVRRAQQNGRFVLTTPDYIGGLEFSGVILVGVDKDRVPPRTSDVMPDSENYLSYVSHQKLYVAITRARFRVEVLGLKNRGESSLLASAIANELISLKKE